MEPKLVDFSVIKQKIIKTDEVLQMYMENSKKLKKTQQAYKDLKSKYEEASNGLNRFQLESDRCTFSLEHITSKHNKLESEYKHLEQQNKLLEQKYCKHMIDSQTAILELQDELRMINELNESAELLSSKKKLSNDDESPKKIKEFEEVVKKLKQNEARFKQENDKLVGDMNKMRNEHSKIVLLLQEQKSNVLMDLNGLKSQIASKKNQYNDILLVKDKEISKLNAEVLALRGLKEQLKCLKEENKKLNNNITCNDITHQKKKLLHSRAVQTQATQDIKSVLEENTLLKTEIKMYKSRISEIESTQTESDDEEFSLQDIFNEMIVIPRMLSPLPEEPLNARTKSSPQSEDKYSSNRDYTKEKSDPDFLEDKYTLKSSVVQKVVPFVKKEECFGYISDTFANYESKDKIIICEENTNEGSAISGHKTENVAVEDRVESKLFAADNNIPVTDIEEKQCTKVNSHLEAKTALPTADIDLNHGVSLVLADSNKVLARFETCETEFHSLKNQSSIHRGDIKENSHFKSELSSSIDNQLYHGIGLSSEDNKNVPLFGASVEDSQEFKNLPSDENPHFEAESTLSKANDEQNYGIDLPSMEDKENLPLLEASQCEFKEIGKQPSMDDINITENPQLDCKSTLSTADNQLHHRFRLLSVDNEQNLSPFENPVGESQDFKNLPLSNVLSIKENSQLEAESTLSTAENQQNIGIALPPMDNKENLPLFEPPEGECQELENKPSKIDDKIREEPVATCTNGKKSKPPQRRKYRFSTKMSDSTRPCFRGHPTSKQIFRKEMRLRKYRRVDSVLRALQIERRSSILISKHSGWAPMTHQHSLGTEVLKRSKINFTISNESTLPVHWKDSNWLDRFSGAPADFGRPSKRTRVTNPVRSGRNVKQSTRKLSCPSKDCNSVSMSLESGCGAANLLGFFNVKQEAISPLGEPLDKKPENPLKLLSDSLHSDTSMETLLEKLADLVSEKLKNGKQSKRKRSVPPSPSQDSEFCSETETELERLIEEPSYDVLERNKMLLKRAKYELGRESTSMTSLETSDTKNSAGTPPFADNGMNTEELEAATPSQKSPDLVSPLKPDKDHSSPPVVTNAAVRALWNKPAPKEEPSQVGAEISKGIFENADSCDSYKFPVCPNLLSPLSSLSSCAADSPKIRHFNLTPKKEDSKINFNSSERKELASICKLEQEFEMLSPIRKIDELRMPRSPGCKIPLGVESRLLHPFEIKRENSEMAIKIETGQLEMATESANATVGTSDPEHLKALEKTEPKKLGCSGIEGLYTDKSPEELYSIPIAQPEVTPLTANNSTGVELQIQPSSNLSGSLENTSPPASSTHRSFQFLNCSSLRQYTNKSRNRKSLTNSNYTLSSFPVFANPKQTPPLSPFAHNELFKPKAELKVSPTGGKRTIEGDFSLSLSNFDKTDVFSVSLRDMEIQKMDKSTATSGSFIDPQESRNVSDELNNGSIFSTSSCISDFIANETKITKEINSFMTKFGMDPSFTQVTSLQNEQTDRVSRKMSASDILDILPRSEEEPSSNEKQEEDEMPSCPQSPELQPAPVNFVPKLIPLEINMVIDTPISNTPITDIQDILPRSEEILSSYDKQEGKEVPNYPHSPKLKSVPAEFVPKVIPLERILVTDAPVTDILDIIPRSEVLSKYENQEGKEVPSCPQSPELQPAPADFVPKVIPLERNLFTDTPITHTPITDTPITDVPDILARPEEVLPGYEKEVPSCPQSPEFQSVPADFVPRIIPLESNLVTDTPITYTSITDTPMTDILSRSTYHPITGSSRTHTLITSTPITNITPTGTPVTGTPITDTLITDAPRTYTSITNTSITDTSITDPPITDAPITHIPITDTPISDTPVTKKKIKKGAIDDTVLTKNKSKAIQRRSKRLSKAVISSNSEAESEDDVCERLKESTTKIVNVNNAVAEQVKRKRGRPRTKEILETEKVVRKRGRPRKIPVKEISADESEFILGCVETSQPKDIVDSNEKKTDVADCEEGQKLTSGVSEPSEENCSSVAPKKVVKPKQKISKLKSNVMRQMKLKQKMFQSDKPGSNICSNNECDVERNDAMETNLDIRSDRLSAETNNSQYDSLVNDIGENTFQSNEPGNNFFSNNDCDVKRNDLIEANVEIRNNRLSADFNNSRFEIVARDPDKRITVVQDILIRAGHKTNNISGLNFEASSSRINGNNIPKKCGRAKKSCDILSQIMGDMDKDRPKLAPKKSVTPKKVLPQGLDDKQWRKGILEIAEITHNKDVEVQENSILLGPDATTDSGILNRGIEMPEKIQFLLKKLMKMSNEDDIPDHVITEFKKLQVDIIVDVIIREVAKDIIDKPDTKHYPAPLMTKKQRIYLALMLKLEQKKVEQLIDKFFARAKHYIFKRGCGLKAAIPLTRLIIGVCRIRADIHGMRMFCCDAFFFIGDLAVPILFTVLTSWIDVIPMEADVKNYPLAKVIVQLVHLKTFYKPGYHLYPLKCLLSQFYGYPTERWNCDTLFEEVFHEYLRNPSPSSDLAIRLFCRNKDTKWVYKKINEFFKPLIYKIPTENENFKATTILLLGKICRQFRLKEEHDRACLAELNRFFAGLLEDDVTELVKRSVSLTLDRLPKQRIKIPKDEKQSDLKVRANERSRIVRKNMTKFLPNPNWGSQNNRRTCKQGFPKRNRILKKNPPRKGTSTKVSTEQ